MQIKKHLGHAAMALAHVIALIVFIVWIALVSIRYAAQCMIERVAA